VEAREARFSRLYRAYARDVLAYALPRAAGPENAADVVAETFLVAWRRIGDVPAGEEGRLWLYGTARRVLANQRRGERRRDRLSLRLGVELAAAVALPPAPGREGAALLDALAKLGEEDREVLLLAGWEELRSPQIARVLGISAVAARVRLHRARRRLRAELAAEGEVAPGPPVTELGLKEGR
jgi:RNA polymerase sigma factor (sigma-70 family)